MKKLKRPEIIILVFTLLFVAFTGGYFTGRRSSVNIITIYPDRTIAAPTANVTPPPDTQDVRPAPESPPQDEGLYMADADSEYVDTDEAYNPDADAPDYQHPDYTDLPVAEPDADPAANDAPIIGAPRGGGSNRMININTASRAELTDLPGIGEVIAGRIVDYRNQHGPFERIEDITNVSGIGPARFEGMRDRITVG